MTQATVLIPTHDHQDTILRAIASIKRQTIQDFEVFVVGDGVPDRTRELMAGICAADDRFRFFDNPKGPRTGEPHRHRALQGAAGKIVCYLADDDLWLPNHLESMLEASQEADFFHALHVGIDHEDKPYFIPSNIQDITVRRLMCHTTANRFGLTFCGHTLSGYRSLPFGWRTAPEGTPTDLHMWRQFLAHDTIRAKTIFRATALGFASPQRIGWSMDQRLAELDRWLTLSQDAEFPAKLQAWLLKHACVSFGRLDMLVQAGLVSERTPAPSAPRSGHRLPRLFRRLFASRHRARLKN
jgi:GalNAc5-diNAcBac-PP-undecaprenol beta-1,3-glucosyltransferase